MLSKLKIMLRGKNFFMRGLLASGLAQALEIFVECLALYAGIMSFKSILGVMAPIFALHILIEIAILIPGAIFINILKKAEGSDIRDTHISFNPFSLEIKTE